MISTYRPSRMISLDIFATLIDTKRGQALAFVEDTKKKKMYLCENLFLLILLKGIFFLFTLM